MDYRIGAIERQFAEIIWKNEPLGSGELVKLAEQEIGWKKSTTYTVLRRLCERGLFKNENGKVEACISREDFDAGRSIGFVEEEFEGSLPAFLAAFTARKKLSETEILQLQKLIDESR